MAVITLLYGGFIGVQPPEKDMRVLDRLRAYIGGIGTDHAWEEVRYSDEPRDVEKVREDIAALSDYPMETRSGSRLGSLLPGEERVELHTDHLDIVCGPGTARIAAVRGYTELNEQEEDLTDYLTETYDAGSERQER